MSATAPFIAQIQHGVELEAHVILALVGTLFDEAVRLVIHAVPGALWRRVGDDVDSRVPGLSVLI